MTLRVFLTVLEIALLVGVLATFLNIVAKQLNRISANLARIAWGVRAVETMCGVIGPAVDRINGNLVDVNNDLTRAAAAAERLA
jgi:phage-related protein